MAYTFIPNIEKDSLKFCDFCFVFNKVAASDKCLFFSRNCGHNIFVLVFLCIKLKSQNVTTEFIVFAKVLFYGV